MDIFKKLKEILDSYTKSIKDLNEKVVHLSKRIESLEEEIKILKHNGD